MQGLGARQTLCQALRFVVQSMLAQLDPENEAVRRFISSPESIGPIRVESAQFRRYWMRMRMRMRVRAKTQPLQSPRADRQRPRPGCTARGVS